MPLEEAIKHCEDVVARCSIPGGNKECGREHQQLAEWLKELKMRRLRDEYGEFCQAHNSDLITGYTEGDKGRTRKGEG